MDDDIRTLSTNTEGSGDDIEGLLYVPDLDSWDPCANISKQYIPNHVTRISSLPTANAFLVALVPWISQNCTRSFLDAARGLKSRALITYLPNLQPGIPPPANDPAWAMSDGGQWKSSNQYPVYAIPGTSGNTLMQALGRYSGNVTSVPYGGIIAEDYKSPDYVRLYVTVGTNSRSSLPSLWEFLLIVLGIVLFLIFITSAIMHGYQRKHPQALHRRVINGEVDLETLGIKGLTVPQDVLDKLPLYVYTHSEKDLSDHPTQPPKILTTPDPGMSPWRLTPTLNPQTRIVSEPLRPTAQPLPSLQLSSTTPQHTPSYGQPTCSICLDEFIPHASSVRELPCHHIYHPTCIDRFLRDHSSLCPLCKARVLPPGYCPATITNAMVRRERQIRERAGQSPRTENANEEGMQAATGRPVLLSHRLPSFQRQFRRPTPANRPGRRISSAPTPRSVEMTTNPTTTTSGPALVVQQTIPAGLGTTEFARGRMLSAFSAHHRDPDDEDRERRARLPKCKFSFLKACSDGFRWLLTMCREEGGGERVSGVSMTLAGGTGVEDSRYTV